MDNNTTQVRSVNHATRRGIDIPSKNLTLTYKTRTHVPNPKPCRSISHMKAVTLYNTWKSAVTPPVTPPSSNCLIDTI
jgi:hypothetical protein